ncbi:CLUMA_CG001883, isoform A [Clunio marinus]|uniref:CLUMA_CG001883, isoform A n=1 Tax=Clunio marinus TaxID=568069 RepID=A0A1J1HKN9_9DIPT|nr:CLUMA_CG001883, isoform A [Clunio marinus]
MLRRKQAIAEWKNIHNSFLVYDEKLTDQVKEYIPVPGQGNTGRTTIRHVKRTRWVTKIASPGDWHEQRQH